MYYPGGMKARVSPVQWSKPHSILAPTQDSYPTVLVGISTNRRHSAGLARHYLIFIISVRWWVHFSAHWWAFGTCDPGVQWPKIFVIWWKFILILCLKGVIVSAWVRSSGYTLCRSASTHTTMNPCSSNGTTHQPYRHGPGFPFVHFPGLDIWSLISIWSKQKRLKFEKVEMQ